MSPVRRPRVARVTVAAALACGLALTGCLVGCSGSVQSQPRPSAAPNEAVDSGTPLQDVDTTALVVPRAPFCDLVDPAAVSRALGDEAADVSAYRSGQRIRISDHVDDVVHEFGCRWTTGDGSAQAWVFAPPVTRERAGTLSEQVRGAPGCSVLPGAEGFGSPTLARSCRRGNALEVSYRGLFGDAWLSCSLTASGAGPEDLEERAGRWCAAVATGAASAG